MSAINLKMFIFKVIIILMADWSIETLWRDF